MRFRRFLSASCYGLILGLLSPATFATPPSPYLLGDLSSSAASVGVGTTGTAASPTRGWFISNNELWTTDGTQGGTSVIYSLPGMVSQLTASGEEAYFVVEDELSSSQVWRSDGTTAGTVPLLVFGRSRGVPTISVGDGCVFAMVPGQVWFAARSPGSAVLVHESAIGPTALAAFGTLAFFADGGTLYTSDGTSAGTQAVTDLTTPAGPASVTALARTGSMVFLGVRRGAGLAGPAAELWKTDGTEAGTLLVHSGPDPSLAGIEQLVEAWPGTVAFVGPVSPGSAVWLSDGTAAGTWFTYSSLAGSSIGRLVPTEGKVFFSNAGRLWVTKGPWGETEPVLSPFWGDDLAGAGGLLFFEAYSTSGGLEPWRSDGTAAGTWQIADLNPEYDSYPHNFAGMGRRALFGAKVSTRHSVWITDGTGAGTTALTPSYPTEAGSIPTAFREVAGRTFFTSEVGFLMGYSYLWVTDGTERSATRLQVVGSGARTLSSGHRAVVSTGDGLWSSDGTASGTLRIDDCGPRAASVGARVVYERRDGVSAGLGSTDGTPDGTAVLFAGGPSTLYLDSSFRVISTPNGRRLLFFDVENDGSYRVWTTDGSISGTVVVSELGPSIPGDPVVLEDRIIWKTLWTRSQPVEQLWSSDGSPSGTRLLREFQGETIDRGLACRHRVYFGRHGANGLEELWASDGTGAGTHAVSTGVTLDPAGPFACAEDRILFQAAPAEGHPPELWTSDGTDAGTRRVAVIDGPAYWISVVGKTFLFSPSVDTRNGRELWSSDGTPEGTSLLRDIEPGPASSAPVPLLASHGRLWFSATDGPHGRELWTTDGSADGTHLVADIAPGPRSSDPASLLETPTRFYFSAFEPTVGREPWALPLPSSFVPVTPCRLVDTRNQGSPLNAGEVRSFARIEGTESCGVAPTARALSANVTVVGPSSGGYLSSSTDADDIPRATTISFGQGRIRSNGTFLALDGTGGFRLFGALPEGATHVVVDVNGYFE